MQCWPQGNIENIEKKGGSIFPNEVLVLEYYFLLMNKEYDVSIMLII